MAALKLSALNKKVSGNKCIPIKFMWENKLREMLRRTTPEELIHQMVKNSKALETGDNTWEGHDSSGTQRQKSLNTRHIFRSVSIPDMPVIRS